MSTRRSSFICFINMTVIPQFTESVKNPSKLQCLVNMNSICPNDKITKWNKKNVGKNLKEWLRSISIEWKYNEYLIGENDCKVFSKVRHDTFEMYAPGVYDPHIVMFGKDATTFNVSNDEQIRRIENTTKHKLRGPIWADLNNRYQWIINKTLQGVSVRLSDKAVLANGLYFGYLSGDGIQLGDLYAVT